MNRRAFLASTGVAATALAGCVVGADGSAGDHDVGMSTVRFRPAVVTVAPGETVRWQNTSSHSHTVTAYEDRIPDGADFFASGGYDSEAAAVNGWERGSGGALYQGDAYEHTFEVPGTYDYFCIPHETSGMTGSVIVESGTTTTE